MPPRTRRILIVEDEFIIAEALADCVRNLGFDCAGPAQSVKAGIDLIDGEPIDAAILDMRLGNDRADDVADALAARKIPFAFAVGELSDIAQRRWPYALILLKPYSDQQVAETLGRLLDGDQPAVQDRENHAA
jgi:DNA-binding response OmpR family regulator